MRLPALLPRLASRLALIALLCGVLTACGSPPREDVCRTILEAILPADAVPKVVAVERDPVSRDGVVLRFEYKETGLRPPEPHHLLCAFSPPMGDPGRFGLFSVEIDGKPISRVKLILLHRWLGQDVPPSLLDSDQPHPHWPLSLHVAYLTQQVLNGLVIGSVIALVAAGYTLVYGITRHIQFAYGEMLAIGAFMTGLAYALLTVGGWGTLAGVILLGLPFALSVGALGGYWIDRVVFRPLRHAETQTALIAAIGLSIFLQEFLRLTQGGQGRWMPPLMPGRIRLFDAGDFDVSIGYSQLVIVVVAAVLSLAQGWLLMRTRIGRSYRACADDPRMASILGVDVTRVVAIAYSTGAALAAAAGAMLILHYGEAGAQMGVMFGFKALTAALLGGIGSFGGALLGGLIIGLIEALWAGYLDGAWRDAAVFAILVLVLMFRPAGLFGHADPLTSGGSYGAPGSALRSRPTTPSPT